MKPCLERDDVCLGVGVSCVVGAERGGMVLVE